MSPSKRQVLARRLRSREFRTTLKRADVANGIAFQLKTLMHARDWNQRDLARASGIAQPLISRYLRGYENYTVHTLDKLADAFEVSLGVRFETYSQLVDYHLGLSPERLLVASYQEDATLREMQSDSGDSLVTTTPRHIPARIIQFPTRIGDQNTQRIPLPERQGTGAERVATTHG